jgi:DNA-directed RNA polymerase subunit K/omega
VRRAVHLEHRDGAARARDIDATQPPVEHHDVGTFSHREVRDGLVRVEIEDRQGVVAFA